MPLIVEYPHCRQPQAYFGEHEEIMRLIYNIPAHETWVKLVEKEQKQ